MENQPDRKRRFRPGSLRPRRLRRPRLPRFNLRKAMFVLPNLFTVSSIFCGFFAIILASGDPSPAQMSQAALAIFFGLFFDMADGRVARLTKTQSDFGVQIDSLADVITFGAAPAVIVHKWALSTLGPLGVFAAFCYVACGAIRLARFNVMAARAGGTPSSFFVGLPIPLAASVLITLVMFHQSTYAEPIVRGVNVLVLTLVLSYLMVSNVRYRSFKRLRPSPRTIATVLVVLALFATVAWVVRPTFALFVFFSGYVVLGMVEEVIFFRRRRKEDQSHRDAGTPPANQHP